MHNPNTLIRLATIGLAALAVAGIPAIAGATVFRLTGQDVVIDQPAPLFTSSSITGTFTLDDAILPGQSFGAASVTGLTLDFGGIVGTLADVQADIAPGAVQLYGTRSLDGSTFSFLDFRFGFQPSVSGCSFVCAGDIIIDPYSADPSNFIAIDDFDGNSLSVISSFTPVFSAVPEPAAWALMLVGIGGLGAAIRSQRKPLSAA